MFQLVIKFSKCGIAVALLVPLFIACRMSELQSTEQSPAARLSLDEGINALREGQVELALELLERALNQAEEDPALQADAHRWLAHGYALASDPERSLLACESGIILNPTDAWLRYAYGVALLTVGRMDESINAFGKAIELNPTHLKAYQWRAHALYTVSRYAEAIAASDQAIAILNAADESALLEWNGNRTAIFSALLLQRADCLDAIGKHEQAESDRQRARAD